MNTLSGCSSNVIYRMRSVETGHSGPHPGWGPPIGDNLEVTRNQLFVRNKYIGIKKTSKPTNNSNSYLACQGSTPENKTPDFFYQI